MSTVVFTISDAPAENGEVEVHATMDFGESGYNQNSIAHQYGRVITEFYRKMMEASMTDVNIEAFDPQGNRIPVEYDEDGTLTPKHL